MIEILFLLGLVLGIMVITGCLIYIFVNFVWFCAEIVAVFMNAFLDWLNRQYGINL